MAKSRFMCIFKQLYCEILGVRLFVDFKIFFFSFCLCKTIIIILKLLKNRFFNYRKPKFCTNFVNTFIILLKIKNTFYWILFNNHVVIFCCWILFMCLYIDTCLFCSLILMVFVFPCKYSLVRKSGRHFFFSFIYCISKEKNR